MNIDIIRKLIISLYFMISSQLSQFSLLNITKTLNAKYKVFLSSMFVYSKLFVINYITLFMSYPYL